MFSSYITVPVYEAFYRWLGYGEQIDPMVEAWKAGDRKAAAERPPGRRSRKCSSSAPPSR